MMKSLLTTVLLGLLKFLTLEQLSKILATCVAWTLRYASRKGGKAWDRSKAVLKNVGQWIDLFNEVYEDDMLDADEEAKIALAIKNMTAAKKIAEIVGEKAKKVEAQKPKAEAEKQKAVAKAKPKKKA